MGVGPEKENATNNTSGKMRKKKKATDEFRLNTLVTKRWKSPKKGKSLQNSFFFLSQGGNAALHECLVNRQSSQFSTLIVQHEGGLKAEQLFSSVRRNKEILFKIKVSLGFALSC